MLCIANLQLKVHADKEKNLAQAEQAILGLEGVDIAVLPEMFTCPYLASNFPHYAEEEGGPSFDFCAKLAKKKGLYLVAGSMPEREGDRIYNTAYVFDKEGKMVAKHRKIHLFDVAIEGGISFLESDTLSPGKDLVVFDTPHGKVGLCVCFDFRFPEMGRLLTDMGAKLLVVPAAFNMTTGPAHWDLLFRTRAFENQVFVTATAPARDLEGPYVSWGHSLVVDPFGTKLSELGAEEGILITKIDLSQIEKVRKELPLINNRRDDLYRLTAL